MSANRYEKRHFQDVADILARAASKGFQTADTEDQLVDIVADFERLFAGHNPLFSASRFRAAVYRP